MQSQFKEVIKKAGVVANAMVQDVDNVKEEMTMLHKQMEEIQKQQPTLILIKNINSTIPYTQYQDGIDFSDVSYTDIAENVKYRSKVVNNLEYRMVTFSGLNHATDITGVFFGNLLALLCPITIATNTWKKTFNLFPSINSEDTTNSEGIDFDCNKSVVKKQLELFDSVLQKEENNGTTVSIYGGGYMWSFSDGDNYKGYFGFINQAGKFHGDGLLIEPSGTIVRGKFKYGNLESSDDA
jgi:hypothetical protein